MSENEELSKIEKEIKKRSDALLEKDLNSIINLDNMHSKFDITNTHIFLQELIEKHKSYGTIRVNSLLLLIKKVLFEKYQNHYFEKAIRNYILRLDNIESEIEDLRNHVGGE